MKRPLLLLVLLAGFSSACLDWDTGIPCRTNHHCPAADVCQDGVCIAASAASSSDGGLVGDGGVRADGG